MEKDFYNETTILLTVVLLSSIGISTERGEIGSYRNLGTIFIYTIRFWETKVVKCVSEDVFERSIDILVDGDYQTSLELTEYIMYELILSTTSS